MKLNDLVDHVCLSLQNARIRKDYYDSFAHRPEAKRLRNWVEAIFRETDYIRGTFFIGFAGQGRVRWHYGAAHPILCDIETSYIAERGRDWLANEEEARNNLVLGAVEEGLLWFDPRELWQIIASIAIVGCTMMGAFVLSYYTPTVGLGCRSGGYMIFGIVTFFLLAGELLVWWLTDEQQKQRLDSRLEQHILRLRSSVTVNFMESRSRGFRERFNATRKSLAKSIEGILITITVFILHPLSRRSRSGLYYRIESNIDHLHELSFRQWASCTFVLLEVFNTVWLVYVCTIYAS